ncbi:MAG: RDD family protein [Campylobacterales bacterium]|nr:RDD family protein [Campylobacterales bacterium]
MNQNDTNIEKLQLATNSSRMKAFIIDDIIITLLVVLILWDKIALTNGDMIGVLEIMNGAFLQIIVLKFFYQTFFIWYYGQTIGKFIAKIKVIDFNHFGKVSLQFAIVRSLGRIVSEAVFYFGFIFAYYTESRQTFHDKLGKTLVVDA